MVYDTRHQSRKGWFFFLGGGGELFISSLISACVNFNVVLFLIRKGGGYSSTLVNLY